ncbi:MAG: sigma-70 family RNA polymerase sigma factor [Rhizomicrobium sp.]
MSAEARPNKELIQELDARFRAPLMAFFIRRVGNRSDAEDLTQETFERLVRSENFSGSGRVSGYVFRVAVNLLRDRRRSAGYRKMQTFSAFEPELLEMISNELLEDREPERVLIGREGLLEVLKCLDELGERTKTVFILYRLEGMKQREIADVLGMGLSTVEKYCMQAMTLLVARFGRKPL